MSARSSECARRRARSTDTICVLARTAVTGYNFGNAKIGGLYLKPAPEGTTVLIGRLGGAPYVAFEA
jgi:hypothetical protein